MAGDRDPRFPPSEHQTWRWRVSRIGSRLLLFNVLVVFLPVAGILYLDVHEQRLLDAQERSMVQQGRLLAAALGGGTTIDDHRAATLLARLPMSDARLRVHDATARVVADSARLSQGPAPGRVSGGADPATDTRDAWLYRVGARLASLRHRVGTSSTSRIHDPTADDSANVARVRNVSSELQAALVGRYGAATRPTPGQRSMTLTVAIPVSGTTGVTGAVTVSQSTYRILQALYAVRLGIFRSIVGSMLVATLISVLVTLTIVRPIRRLRRTALALAAGGRPLPGSFPGTHRRDEIGDLARSLDELTRRLHAHVALLESFAADVAHEFRNPLASIRTAADVLEHSASAEERARFTMLLQRDVERLDRLVCGVRDLARLDRALQHIAAEPVDLAGVVEEQLRLGGYPTVRLAQSGGPTVVSGDRDQLLQVVENLLDNARSFSPADGSVSVTVEGGRGVVRLLVCDRGPGIPPEHLTRVFDRFFSYRPGSTSGRHEHAGLGLAIARSIVNRHGGTIAVRNRDDAGACVEVSLPAMRP